MNLKTLTIAEARRALDAKEYSALELTNEYLKAIREHDGEIHAYLEVWEKTAREEAKKADEMIALGKSRPLTGIPLAVKDNILIEGRVASAGSKMLEKYTAVYDATVIAKLKEQDAVFLGRTNMDEFAMGSSTENSAYGPTKNPRDTRRVPGGSSGGSAAAVAGGFALAALGSDTGGSIRQPASLTGLVGLKPTYGAVSRYGLIAMGSSLDQIGPLAKTAADAKTVFDAIRGYDERDSTSLPNTQKSDLGDSKGRTLKIGLPSTKTKPLVLGVPRTFLEAGVDTDVLERFEKTIKTIKSNGYEVRDIEMPNLQHSLAVYYIVMPAESSTNLARFDGVRYGLSIPAETIQEVYAKTRGQGFGPEVRRRILVGTFVLSSGYADAYYRKALAVREIIRADFARVFSAGGGSSFGGESVDAVVTPTCPAPAFSFGAKSDPLAMYAEDIFSVPANLAGVPALSVPMGTVAREGKDLPVGFQIIGTHGSEEMLFEIGKDIL